jgi:hypothetical protein
MLLYATVYDKVNEVDVNIKPVRVSVVYVMYLVVVKLEY